MKHGVNYMRRWYNVGDTVPVYPFYARRYPNNQPFVGTIERVRKNKYGRIDYFINGLNVQAEELWPARNQAKLRMRCSP